MLIVTGIILWCVLRFELTWNRWPLQGKTYSATHTRPRQSSSTSYTTGIHIWDCLRITFQICCCHLDIFHLALSQVVAGSFCELSYNNMLCETPAEPVASGCSPNPRWETRAQSLLLGSTGHKVSRRLFCVKSVWLDRFQVLYVSL